MRKVIAAGIIVKRSGKQAEMMRAEGGPLLTYVRYGKFERMTRQDITRRMTIKNTENFLPPKH